ncbi:hypothetical protein [Aeromicrobium fastidiosum]|uniref:hypothetical protein n=1 Tax=Aeromicrobium fastidiosum TaxID=52699 RepID=UPI00100ED994|nr:hypothetical protein [Aeromicrobium fastidiosum]
MVRLESAESDGMHRWCRYAADVLLSPVRSSELGRFQSFPGEPWATILDRVVSLTEAPFRDEARSLIDSGRMSTSGQIYRSAGIADANLMSCYVEAPDEHGVSDEGTQIAGVYQARVAAGAGLGMNLGRSSKRAGGAVDVASIVSEVGYALDDLSRRTGTKRTASAVSLSLDAEIGLLADRCSSESHLRHFNLVVNIHDGEMRSLVKETQSAALDVLVEAIWRTGLPCVTFIDSVNRLDPWPDIIDGCNPCGEQYLPPGHACNLGSINLAAYFNEDGEDWDGFRAAVRSLARLLDAAVDATSYPSVAHRVINTTVRRIGMGVMGFATSLERQGLRYGGQASTEFLAESLSVMNRVARDEVGNRPYVTSIAPTGGISRLMGVSPGIEPLGPATSWRDHIAVLAAAQREVDNAVSTTVLLPSSAQPDEIRAALVLAWQSGCKGVSFYRDGCRPAGGQVAAPMKVDA